jgi:hypothetical protein
MLSIVEAMETPARLLRVLSSFLTIFPCHLLVATKHKDYLMLEHPLNSDNIVLGRKVQEQQPHPPQSTPHLLAPALLDRKREVMSFRQNHAHGP